MQPFTLAKRGWLLVFLAVITFYFYGLGAIPFVGPDEPRYAQVAREMFLRGDLITPTLAGHTWFEKPPLLYWMMIASFRLFGISEWSARLGPAISGLLTVVAVFWVARRVCRSSQVEQATSPGSWCGLVAASTLGLIVLARGLGFDIVLTMTTAWALSFLLASTLADSAKEQIKLLAGFYVFVGLSLLAKGLVGLVIPFGVFATYQLLRREFPSKRLLWSFTWGLPLMLAVAAVWYVPVILRHGWPFIDQFFVQHHFARYLSNKYHHPQPFYFYLLVIVPLSLPWVAFLLEGLAKTRMPKLRGSDSHDHLRAFSLAWFLLPLVFFSFSGSKLPGYVLPVLPAGALIAGDRLASYVAGQARTQWVARVTGGIFALFALAGFVYAISSRNLPFWCAAMMAVLLIAVAAACFFWTTQRTIMALLVAFATFASIVIAMHCGLAKFAERESLRNVIQLADIRGYGAAPVYVMHDVDRSLEFYAAGRLVYAADGHPMKLEGGWEALEAARKAGNPVLIAVPLEYVYQLTGLESGQTEIIGNNGRMALVALSERRK